MDDTETCDHCDSPIKSTYPSDIDGSFEWCECEEKCLECGNEFTDKEIGNIYEANSDGEYKNYCATCLAHQYYEVAQDKIKELNKIIAKMRRKIWEYEKEMKEDE